MEGDATLEIIQELRARIANLEEAAQSSAPNDHVNRDEFNMTELATAVALAVRNAPNAACMPGPPTYTGEQDSLDWSTFLDLFGRNLQLNGWDHLESDQRARLLQSSLRLQAATVFHSLSDNQKNNYEDAVNALTRIFVNPAKITLYQNEFEERHQRKGEKSSRPGNAFKTIGQKGISGNKGAKGMGCIGK